MNSKAYIIYLEDSVLLSKKEYLDWHGIQDEYYENYKTSLSPMTCEEIILFFKDDYGNEHNWPFSRKAIEDFFENTVTVISSNKQP